MAILYYSVWIPSRRYDGIFTSLLIILNQIPLLFLSLGFHRGLSGSRRAGNPLCSVRCRVSGTQHLSEAPHKSPQALLWEWQISLHPAAPQSQMHTFSQKYKGLCYWADNDTSNPAENARLNNQVNNHRYKNILEKIYKWGSGVGR